MKHTTTRIPDREEFHKLYAGEICPADFNTDAPCGHIISRIAQAFRFDYQCRQDYEERKRRKTGMADADESLPNGEERSHQ